MDSKDKKSEQLRVEFDNVKEVSSIKNPMEKRMNSLTPTTSNVIEREAMSSKYEGQMSALSAETGEKNENINQRKCSRSPSPCAEKEIDTIQESRKSPEISSAENRQPEIEVAGGQQTAEGIAQSTRNLGDELEAGEGGTTQGEESDRQASSKLRAPPLLLVTHPSVQWQDGDGAAAVDSSTQITLKLSPENNYERDEGLFDDDEGEDEEQEYSDEDFTDEDEEYTDEEEWESDWDIDEACVCRTLQLSSISGDYESDFELPFELDKNRDREQNVGARLPQSVAMPPPIFTASIVMSESWGTSGEGRSYSDGVSGSWSGISCEGGDEVAVGFTLVQRAAMRASDEEMTTTTSGSYTTSSGSYNSYDDDDEEEKEKAGETVEEEAAEEQRSFARNLSLEERSISHSRHSSSSSGELAESVCSANGEEQLENIREPELVLLTPMEEDASTEQAELGTSQIGDDENVEMCQLLEDTEMGGPDDDKQVRREETYVREQMIKEGGIGESTRTLPGNARPRTDFAKKAVVQPMRAEKVCVGEICKPLQAPTEEDIQKKRAEEEEEVKRKMEELARKKAQEEAKERKIQEELKLKNKADFETDKKRQEMMSQQKQKQMKTEETTKARTAEEGENKDKAKSSNEGAEGMDKMAQRTVPEEGRMKTEKQEQGHNKQQTQQIGSTGRVRSRFQPSEPILPIIVGSNEPITYKRSTLLEPKPVNEQRQKRVFAPIAKPEQDDQFEKQMAELREQMRKDTKKLQSEFRDVSQGLKNASTEAKQKTKEQEHKRVLGHASDLFGKAEMEKKRQREMHDTEEERKKQKQLEKEQKPERMEKERLEAADSQIAKRLEPRRTIRRAAKEPKQEIVKKDESEANMAMPTKRYGDKLVPRRKTEELMKFGDADQQKQQQLGGMASDTGKTRANDEPQKVEAETAKKNENSCEKESKIRKFHRRRSTRHGHHRRFYIRTPFDIDEMLGWRGMESFEKMDAFFASRGSEKRQLREHNGTNTGEPAPKRRGLEPQKIWISELRDIDKLYKASELRDIKLSAGA